MRARVCVFSISKFLIKFQELVTFIRKQQETVKAWEKRCNGSLSPTHTRISVIYFCDNFIEQALRIKDLEDTQKMEGEFRRNLQLAQDQMLTEKEKVRVTCAC